MAISRHVLTQLSVLPHRSHTLTDAVGLGEGMLKEGDDGVMFVLEG